MIAMPNGRFNGLRRRFGGRGLNTLGRQEAAFGVDLAEVTRFLEADGVTKFAASYRQLLAGIETKAGALAGK